MKVLNPQDGDLSTCLLHPIAALGKALSQLYLISTTPGLQVRLNCIWLQPSRMQKGKLLMKPNMIACLCCVHRTGTEHVRQWSCHSFARIVLLESGIR